jgi:hypothetical protein
MNPVENIEDLKPSAKGNIDIAISFARDTIAYVGTLNLIFGMTNDQLQISHNIIIFFYYSSIKC